MMPCGRIGAPGGRRGRRRIGHTRGITGTVAEWEEWTNLPLPESGAYVFPGGLATVEIDRERDGGRYWEPNVWMIHAELSG